jgi:hypothetical protein
MKQVLDVIHSYTPEGYALTQVWLYKGAAGDSLGAVARYDLAVANGERS